MDTSEVVRLCQGNPGAIRVLMSISSIEPMFMNPLTIALDLTGSKSYGLWVVYKDMCGFDIQKTMDTLKRWFDGSVKPLELWCEEQGYA